MFDRVRACVCVCDGELQPCHLRQCDGRNTACQHVEALLSLRFVLRLCNGLDINRVKKCSLIDQNISPHVIFMFIDYVFSKYFALFCVHCHLFCTSIHNRMFVFLSFNYVYIRSSIYPCR